MLASRAFAVSHEALFEEDVANSTCPYGLMPIGETQHSRQTPFIRTSCQNHICHRWMSKWFHLKKNLCFIWHFICIAIHKNNDVKIVARGTTFMKCDFFFPIKKIINRSWKPKVNYCESRITITALDPKGPKSTVTAQWEYTPNASLRSTLYSLKVALGHRLPRNIQQTALFIHGV